MKNIFIATCLFMLLMPTAYSAGLKVGVVKLNKVWADSPQATAIDSAMKERFDGKKKELDAMQNELKTMQDNYKRNELVMTEDKLNEMRSDMSKKYQQFKQNEAVLAQEVNTMRSQELASLEQTTRGIVEKIAKDDKYDLILNDGVLYNTDALDISDKVLAGLKKVFKKK